MAVAGICLPPETITKIKQALINGEINPSKLSQMSSESRHALFKQLANGEAEAKWLNSNFESKLLLKNQQKGYLTWAKKITGITPTVRRDLISRIEKMDKVLSPTEEKLFLKDLASTRLGIDVTAQEAKQIANMSLKVQAAEAKRLPNGTFKTETDRMTYGYAKADMGSFLSGKKLEAEKKGVIGTLKSNPAENASRLAGVAKSVRASFDNSAIFRQGWKTLWTNPITWQKNARKTFTDLARVGFKNEDIQREVMADIVSRPNADKYAKMKLAIGNIEEEFPSAIQNKIPLAGRVFKASEAAYENFLYRTRADIADTYLKIAEAGGVNINDPNELRSMGEVINSLTGRGGLGRHEGSQLPKTLNNVFFSVRFLKANIDTLTVHAADRNLSAFARKKAATNLLKVITGTATVLTIANAMKPGSVDWDPRSANFGKIKIGNTTFDVSGGMGSIIVLAGRQITGQTKSSTTGVITDYGSGYGQTSRQDGIIDFFTGKFSPAAGVARDILKGKDFNGNKPTVKSAAANLFIPMPITNAKQNYDDPNSAPLLATIIADGLGIGASTNTPKRNLSNEDNLGSTQKAFKQKVGEKRFNEANSLYNKQYNEWLSNHKDQLSTLPEDEQQTTLTQVKSKIQKKIYEKYNFKMSKRQKPSGMRKSLLESIK